MVRNVREHNTEHWQKFFLEALEADLELERQLKIIDTKNESLLKLRDESKGRNRRDMFCIPISTNVKRPGLFEEIV